MTVCVHPLGVTLASHGTASLRTDIAAKDDATATDGLGSVVVFGPALKAAVKDHSSDPMVTIERGPDGAPVLVLRGTKTSRLWTVSVPAIPVAVQSEQEGPIDYGLTPALVRALVFASTDEARPNLCCVNLRGLGDEIEVCSTDGHRLYRERVPAPGFGERSYTIARTVLTSLRTGKRAGAYRFIFRDDGSCVVACEGREIECARYGHTFPPYEQIVRLLSEDDAHVELPRASIPSLLAWLAKTEKVLAKNAEDLKYDALNESVKLSVAPNGLVFTPAVHVYDQNIEHVIECEVPEWIARGLPVAVQLPYLSEALAAFSGPIRLVALGLRDPVYLFNDTQLALIMPVRM